MIPQVLSGNSPLQGAKVGPDVNASVSIIILTHNSNGTVNRLVDRLLPQLSESRHELVFLDSSSSDGTVEYLRTLPYPNKRILPVEEGTFSHSRTRMWGADICTSDIVVFFTDDIIPIGDSFLEELIKPVLSGAVAASCGISLIDPATGDPLRARRYNGWFEARPDSVGPFTQDEWQALSPAERFYHCRFDDCAACYHRSVLREVRFPDVPYGEDIAVAKRLLLSGYRIGVAKNAKFYHWHDISFSYFIRRMCIDQVVIKEISGHLFIKNMLHFMIVVMFQIIIYAYLSVTTSGLSLRKRIIWFIFSLKYITADNLGKYIGSLDHELSRFHPIKTYLLGHKNSWLETIYTRSIGRNL